MIAICEPASDLKDGCRFRATFSGSDRSLVKTTGFKAAWKVAYGWGIKDGARAHLRRPTEEILGDARAQAVLTSLFLLRPDPPESADG